MARIYFASNRDVKFETSKSARNFGHRFNAAGPQCFRVGHVEVDLDGSPLDDDDSVWKVGTCELYPETLDDDAPEGALLGSAKMFEDLRVLLRQSPSDVIVFLHGFASTFADSARRAAQLQSLYGDDGKRAIVVMFSWPSDGAVFPSWNYVSDRDDAEASGLAMGRALKRLVEFLVEMRAEDRAQITAARRRGEVPDENMLKQCRRQLHVVAHSMGNWALRHAVRKFVQENDGKVPRIFNNSFLMAADEDEDALERKSKLADLLNLSNRVHVYHASDDVALEVSDKTKGNADRLGSDGPANLDLLPERVLVIDCDRVSFTTLSHGNHQYYRLRKEVIADVVATLDGVPQFDRPGRVAIRDGRSWQLQRGAG